MTSYLDYRGRDDVLSGGIRLIPISTEFGTFKVWTKRVGNNDETRLLFLHGGPGATHEYFEAADSYLPAAGIEYYYYDQLGSTYSDHPEHAELWELDRFVDELEQVRKALQLDRHNFFLLGHSWGGLLAMEYALQYQSHIKGLVISNMMASVPAYNTYAETVLMPRVDPDAMREIKELEAAGDFGNRRYSELLVEHYYSEHVLRMPTDSWPDPVLRMSRHTNPDIYVPMQGPSEMGIGPGAKLAQWSRWDDLPSITVPALVIGAEHDTMDPAHMRGMAERLPQGRYLHCANGGHLCMYDDQVTYFTGLIDFLQDVSGTNDR
jgi:proline iminopeptidase